MQVLLYIVIRFETKLLAQLNSSQMKGMLKMTVDRTIKMLIVIEVQSDSFGGTIEMTEVTGRHQIIRALGN